MLWVGIIPDVMRCKHAWLVIIHVHLRVAILVQYYFEILTIVNTNADSELSEYIYSTTNNVTSRHRDPGQLLSPSNLPVV